MTSVLDIFDDVPSRDNRKLLERWHSEVQRSLRSQRSEWMAAADAGALDRDAGWWLLGWVEDAASEVASGAPAELVVDAAFAMSLLEASPLDRRDVLTVAALVRRAASMAGADYAGAVRAGCQAAGALGEAIEPWLLNASEALPPTYEQVVSGDAIVFRRTQPEVGMTEEEALRWLGE